MKKRILSIMVLAFVQFGLAMEQLERPVRRKAMASKQNMPNNTALSAQEVNDLRQAIDLYKQDWNRKEEQLIILYYAQKYPNDPFVKAKMAEKAKFDAETARSYAAESARLAAERANLDQ